MDRLYIEGLTKILRVDGGGALTLGSGKCELKLRQGERGTDSDISHNTKVGICICIDAEGRPNREYPGEVESRNADFKELEVWSLEGALGVGIDVEDGRNVSGNTASESLARFWLGSGDMAWRVNIRVYQSSRGQQSQSR
jgi:hypothetical protein